MDDLLADLIRIDSTNPDLGVGAGEAAIAEFVVSWFADRGVETELQDTGVPGRPNVIARVSHGDGPTLMLNGHLDTVGAGGHAEPFHPHVSDGHMYGRGSMDTKGGVAALMRATVAAQDLPLSGTVLFTGVADEEYASLGTAAVVAEYTADAAIVTEPSALAITIAHKGFEWFEVETRGFAAHGSLPEVGMDAIAMMGPVLTGVASLDADLRRTEGHHLVGTGSAHASLIKGGQEWSSYPSECVLSIERRTIPGETTQSTQQEIERILVEARTSTPAFAAELRHVMSRQPYEISREDPFVDLLVARATDVLGRPPVVNGHSGWMDTAFLGAAGIPAAVLGPAGAGLHGDVEWVDLASVAQVEEIVIATIREFCA